MVDARRTEDMLSAATGIASAQSNTWLDAGPSQKAPESTQGEETSILERGNMARELERERVQVEDTLGHSSQHTIYN